MEQYLDSLDAYMAEKVKRLDGEQAKEWANRCSALRQLRADNAKLRDLLTDVLHGSRDHQLTDYEGPSLEPTLRDEIRAAVRPTA